MLAPKLAQSRPTHPLTAHNPSKRIVTPEASLDLTCAAHPRRDRLQPQRQQHPHARHLAPRTASHRLATLEKRRQITCLHHAPEKPRSMLRRQDILENLK